MDGELLTAEDADGIGEQDEDEFCNSGVSRAKGAFDGIIECVVVFWRDQARRDEVRGCGCETGAEDDFGKDEHGNRDDEACVGAEVSQERNHNLVAEGLMPDGGEDEQNDPGDNHGERCSPHYARSARSNETESTLEAVERAAFHEKKLTALWRG